MSRQYLRILTLCGVITGLSTHAWATMRPWDPSQIRGPVKTLVANPNVQNRVHDAGKVWMNITNYGYFGNEGPGQAGTLDNPCPPGDWAVQCEFPGGSGQQYLYRAALWVGALVEDSTFVTKRVSVGFDGWFDVKEMYPGESASDGITELSTRPGSTNCLGVPVYDPINAVSDQDFTGVYADTLRDQTWVANDPIDGPHDPLGIKITQTSYSFSQAFAEDFILIDYEFENIASNFLKNVFIGLYVDSDVGPGDQLEHHIDDICGFVQNYYEVNDNGDTTNTIPIDVAWIADNDGRPPEVGSGPFDCPHISGTRVIRGPNPRLRTSFNWWVSHGQAPLDFGPAWEAYCARDSLGLGWTATIGTPVGDEHKYQIMSNGEFDYDQVMVDRPNEVTPQIVPPTPTNFDTLRPWGTECDPAENQGDIANGFDTRYLLSWGPLGVFEYEDDAGNRIYRLNPGEKFRMTIAYVCGENFHDVNNPQPDPEHIDSSLFNFADLRENARWAKDVYDNRMFDTPQFDFGEDGIPSTGDTGEGDGKMDTGDGWYGEDVGTDGLYIEPPVGFRPGIDSIEVVYFKHTPYERVMTTGKYSGPDADGSERNGVLDPGEDNIMDPLMVLTPPYVPERLGYWDMGWMSGNSLLDMGDGIPDFTGPPPPPIPALMDCLPGTMNSAAHFGGVIRDGCYVGGLGYVLTDDLVLLRWSKSSSEDTNYVDPFSRVQDFEGYRIHVGNINQEGSYSLLAQYDRIDFAYYSENDSLMTIPVENTEGMAADTFINNIHGTLKPVGLNTGFADLHQNPGLDEWYYEFPIPAHKLAPRYYAVTAFDFGDPKSGLGPLTTRPTANAVLLAPAGDEQQPVRVVPNPYRAYQDYTQSKLGISWENQNDGTREFYSQQDRRIEFINLPHSCLIRVFTVAGDLVQIIPHNMDGDRSAWASETSERWDLNSRNSQQVVSGIYLFSVEDRSEGGDHEIQTGKFVIIR